MAAIASMVVAGIWFTMMFAKQWKRAVGKSDEELKKGTKGELMVSFVLSLIIAYVLAAVMYAIQAGNSTEAIQTAFGVWLGFILTTNGQDYLCDRPAFQKTFLNQ